MNTTKPRQQKTSVHCFFKVIKPTQHGWEVLVDHLDYDQAEHLADENPGSFVRFSSYSVKHIGTKQQDEQPELTALNSRVAAVYTVTSFDELGAETIGKNLEYADALALQDSRKTAMIEFEGYRRVLMPAMPEEPQKYRERRAQGYNRANSIVFRLFLLPFLTVVLLAALVIIKKVGAL